MKEIAGTQEVDSPNMSDALENMAVEHTNFLVSTSHHQRPFCASKPIKHIAGLARGILVQQVLNCWPCFCNWFLAFINLPHPHLWTFWLYHPRNSTVINDDILSLC